MHRNTASSQLVLTGGSAAGKGAEIDLHGESRSPGPGSFNIQARNSNGSRSLTGSATGNLTWNGNVVQTTSDARLKTPLSSVPDEVFDAWAGVEWGQFRFLDAVSEKGDSARLHVGLVSQSVQRVFAGRGLDACAYGILCHELQDAYDVDETVVVREAYTDENGVFHPEETRTEHIHDDAVDLWMIRYAEAFAMEAAYMRRENARLKKRVSDLEDRLAALELRLGSE